MELIDALAPYTSYSAPAVAVFIGVLSRITALVFFLPGLGERTVSTPIRLGAAFAISMILMPIIWTQSPAAPENSAQLISLIAAELIAGSVIGFSIRLAIYTVQIAGSIAAQSASLSQLFAGMDGIPEPPISTLFAFAATALAMSAGLHFKAVLALSASYDVMPFGLFPGANEAGEWAVMRVSDAFAKALALSMPFVVLGFLYNLAIGAANRAMPQLMVALVGAPAISLASMVLLAVAAPVVLDAWMQFLDGILDTLTGNANG